jgi:predicted DNA binding CopG/RHH family protein
MLAALAAPSSDATDHTTAWSGSDLGEDVATLSYERALRAHARYKPADRGDWALTQAARKGPSAAQEESALPEEQGGEGLAAHSGAAKQAAADPDMRSASVTVRLSKAEHERLHRRAAEAGVTVSSYLRSCTFEAETLRAQVKEALADLRSGGARGTEGPREQENKGLKQRGNEGIRIARVLAHIGNLCIGLSSGKSS